MSKAFACKPQILYQKVNSCTTVAQSG